MRFFHKLSLYSKRIHVLGFLLILGCSLLVSCKSAKVGQENKYSIYSNKRRPADPLDDKTRKVHELFMDANKQKILGNNDKAVEIYLQLLNLDPKNAPAMYELAQLYSTTGKSTDAIGMAEKATEYDPSNTWYLYLYAQLLQQIQAYGDAVNVYRQMVALEPNNTDFMEDLAEVCVFAGKYSDALKTLDQVEDRRGVTENISLQKQKIYLHLGKLDKAAMEIQKLIDQHPEDPKYYQVLAETYLNNGQKEKALETYNKVLQLNPDDPYIHVSLSDYYRKTGNNDMSYQELKKAFASPSLEIDTKVQILLSYYTVTAVYPELKNQAFELLDILVKVHPHEARAYSIYADFLYREKKNTEARDMFRKVITLDSSRYPVWEQLLRIESDMEDSRALAAESKRAIDLFPEQPGTFFFNGVANYQLKNYQQAIKSFKSASELVIENDELLSNIFSFLGDAYNQVKDNKLSDDSYEKALKINYDNSYVLNNYSYYLSLRNENLDKAEKMAKRANEITPDNSSYLDTYAWILYRKNNLEEAEKWIMKAIEHGGDKSAVVLEHAGDILYKKGDTQKAFDFWIRAKATGQGSELLDKKINDKKLYE